MANYEPLKLDGESSGSQTHDEREEPPTTRSQPAPLEPDALPDFTCRGVSVWIPGGKLVWFVAGCSVLTVGLFIWSALQYTPDNVQYKDSTPWTRPPWYE